MGAVVYGDVLYRRPFNVSQHGRDVPVRGWLSSKDVVDVSGPSPAPVFASLSHTQHFDDCHNEECAIFFMNRDYITAMLEMSCNRDMFGQWCICREVDVVRHINPSEIDHIREQFLTQGFVSINDFLLRNVLQEYMDDLPKYKPYMFWFWTFWNEHAGAELIPDWPDHEFEHQRWMVKMQALRAQGKYAYYFGRSTSNTNWYSAYYLHRYFKDTVELLCNARMLRLLENITNYSHELSEYFYSRYTSGNLCVFASSLHKARAKGSREFYRRDSMKTGAGYRRGQEEGAVKKRTQIDRERERKRKKSSHSKHGCILDALFIGFRPHVRLRLARKISLAVAAQNQNTGLLQMQCE